MSDLFHENVPFEFVDKIFAVINKTPQHRYQILTKRAERMSGYFTTHNIPVNVWLGVTVETKDTRFRIDYLRKNERNRQETNRNNQQIHHCGD